jgi:hypothetical protein
MPNFKIEVTRIGYASRTIEVGAADEPEAQRIALDTAGNYQFTEHDAEYQLARGTGDGQVTVPKASGVEASLMAPFRHRRKEGA